MYIQYINTVNIATPTTPSSLLHWLYCFGRLIYYNIKLMIICKKSPSWITLFYRSSNNKMQKLSIDIIFFNNIYNII